MRPFYVKKTSASHSLVFLHHTIIITGMENKECQRERKSNCSTISIYLCIYHSLLLETVLPQPLPNFSSTPFIFHQNVVVEVELLFKMLYRSAVARRKSSVFPYTTETCCYPLQRID